MDHGSAKSLMSTADSRHRCLFPEMTNMWSTVVSIFADAINAQNQLNVKGACDIETRDSDPTSRDYNGTAQDEGTVCWKMVVRSCFMVKIQCAFPSFSSRLSLVLVLFFFFHLCRTFGNRLASPSPTRAWERKFSMVRPFGVS